MTTYQWQVSPSLASDAAYRAWGKAMHDAFIQAGLVQTADTGQVDWTTAVLGANTANTAYHTEMYRLNDAFQATTPIFFKMEYGRQSASIDTPVIWITVGRGTNGAGVITPTAILMIRSPVFGGSTSGYGGPTPYPCFLGADGGGFVMVVCPSYNPSSTSSPAGFFMFERSRDAQGAPTEDAFCLIAGNAASTHWSHVYGKQGIRDTSQHINMAALGYVQQVNSGSTLAVGGFPNTPGISKTTSVVNLAPIPLMVPGANPWNSKLIMWCHPGDVGYAPVVNLDRYGTPHTYRMFPHVYSNLNAPIAVTTTAYAVASYTLPAILWDA